MADTSVSNLIRPINLFERDFGNCTAGERDKITLILRVFMEEIRAILDQSMRMVGICTPEIAQRCETCAFNPLLDGLPGFAPTAYGLLQAIRSDKVFLCHAENPDWNDQHLVDPENPLLCNGFEAVRIYSGSKAYLCAHKAKTQIDILLFGLIFPSETE